ncbi:MAG: hypothetical protein GY760_23100 [Deltaproteobacteria bacterium]|nr:hypothetical protein [Deltaproteobacteria bacterium]
MDNRLEKWAFFFKREGLESEEEKMKILIKNDPVMKHAHNNYEKFRADDELLQVYEAREKRLHDEATRLSDALEEGRQKGFMESAKKMKKLGVSTNIICKSTGLTEKEIEKL